MKFDEKYNDTYKTRTELIGNDEYYFAETEYHILQNRRKELGMTQQEVADKSNILLRQYQRLESGERSMQGASFRIALSICRTLQLDPFRFII